MKDRHVNIEADSKLLKLIYATVDEQLDVSVAIKKRLLFLKGITYFSLLMVLYYFIFWVEDPLLFTGCFIAFGLTAVLTGFNFAHDFSHNTVFKNKKLNNFCFTVLYTLVGAHAEAWKFRHVHSHHYAPNVQHYDSDLQITSLIRVEPTAKHQRFHQYQHWYAPLLYTTYSLYWVFIKDMVIYFTERTSHTKHFTYHLSFWIQKLAYVTTVLLLPLLFAPQHWYVIVVAFIAMHLVQSLFLLFTFFITHHVEKTAYFTANHDGYITTSWVNNQVKSSNDFYPFSQAANFVFGGFNNHIAHHLFPTYQSRVLSKAQQNIIWHFAAASNSNLTLPATSRVWFLT